MSSTHTYLPKSAVEHSLALIFCEVPSVHVRPTFFPCSIGDTDEGVSLSNDQVSKALPCRSKGSTTIDASTTFLLAKHIASTVDFASCCAKVTVCKHHMYEIAFVSFYAKHGTRMILHHKIYGSPKQTKPF